MKTKLGAFLLATVCGVSMLAGCGNVYSTSAKTMTSAEANKELESLLSKVQVSQISNPIMDIYADTPSEADALADIDTFPITEEGNGQINLEIAAATELSATAPDDWINVVAKKFNQSRQEVNGQTVSVSIRKIASGEAVTYMEAGLYKPEMFIPSNDAWGKMLEASGIGVEKIADRVAGNTAGVLIEKSAYQSFVEKYSEVTAGNILKAANAGDLTFAYTNPYTSSTGLNILCSMLQAFDPNDPLSDTASQALLEYQKTAPPVAYTTAVLRNSAAKGLVNAMVMEEQAYINTPELRSYQYVPMGIRHDHPVYVFDWDTEAEKEAAELFVDFCQSNEMQKLATEKGFNRHDEYKSQEHNMTGTDYLAAQKLWKQNKNGGRPVVAVFIADVSGSMDGEPLNALKSSLINTLPYIGSEHYIGLVSYANDVTINLPIDEFNDKQRAYFAGETKALTAQGGTATYDAVLVAMDMIENKLKEIPDAKPLIFVLTDGDQNLGFSLDRIIGIVGGLNIPVYSIAYNYSGNGELETLSSINEATTIKTDSDGIVNQLRNLFNVNL